jgi:HK97 family phage major capsid protein
MTLEELLAELKALIDAAAADGREDFNDEEAQRYQELEGKIERAQANREAKQRAEGHLKVRNDAPKVSRAVNKKEDTLERAFDNYLRTGKENADIVELRAQSSGTGSEGGYTVTPGFLNQIIDKLKDYSGTASVAQEHNTPKGNPIRWVTTDDTANVGEIVQENGTFVSGADIVYGTASLDVYSYAAGGESSVPIRVPLELLQDSDIDIAADVADKLAERIGRIQATHLVTGNGAGQPKGIVHGLTGVEIAADGAGIVYDDLINFIFSVDPAYRKGGNCKWLFNDNMLKTIMKLKDSHGDPIWRPDSADLGTDLGGGTLLGYPVVIDQAFPDMTANSNTINWGAFGDFKKGYVVRRVKEVEILVNPYSRMANRQVEYSAWARMGATQQDTNAYVALTGEA